MLQCYHRPSQYFIAECTSLILSGIVTDGRKEMSAGVEELGTRMMRQQA